MILDCVHEYNNSDTLLYSSDFVGAYTRGKNLDEAKSKMHDEIISYCKWCNLQPPIIEEINIIQANSSKLRICDADTEILFNNEKTPLSSTEYVVLKNQALKSALDFLKLYNSVEDKNLILFEKRKTFYGEIPNTAEKIYKHTLSVNNYYFGEIGVKADNKDDIYTCRLNGFITLEKQKDFLANTIFTGSFNEQWTLRKMIRRFIWHDRIHAKSLYRRAREKFSDDNILNPFCF